MIAGYEPGRYHILSQLLGGVNNARKKGAIFVSITAVDTLPFCFPRCGLVSIITLYLMLRCHRVGDFEWQDSMHLYLYVCWYSLCIQASNMLESTTDKRETMLHDSCVCLILKWKNKAWVKWSNFDHCSIATIYSNRCYIKLPISLAESGTTMSREKVSQGMACKDASSPNTSYAFAQCRKLVTDL